MTTNREYLDFASEIAFRAGRLALSYFQRPIDIDRKSDASPVTVADRSAEELLRGEIEARFPRHGILGEEGDDKPSTGDGPTHRWILDPIDGTRSFIAGVPLWGVLVALEVDQEVSVGVCYLPGLDEIYAAAKGEGCRLNGRLTRVSETSELSKAVACVTDPIDLQSRQPAFWERLRSRVGTLRGWSDCYGHCLVAAGRSDLAFDPIMNVWDNAALKPIIEEAGGVFTDWSSEPTIYGESAVSSNAKLRDELSEMLSPREGNGP